MVVRPSNNLLPPSTTSSKASAVVEPFVEANAVSLALWDDSGAVLCDVLTVSGEHLCAINAGRGWRVLTLKDEIAREVQTPQGIWDLILLDKVLEDPSEQPLLQLVGDRISFTIVQLSPADQCSKALKVGLRAGHADPEVRRWAKEELLQLHAGGFDPVVKRSSPVADFDGDCIR